MEVKEWIVLFTSLFGNTCSSSIYNVPMYAIQTTNGKKITQTLGTKSHV